MRQRTKKNTPKLVEIDLSKRCLNEGSDDDSLCDHPDIKGHPSTIYVAKIDGSFTAGFFGREWFGLSFTDVDGSFIQLDDEGWEGLWEVRGGSA